MTKARMKARQLPILWMSVSKRQRKRKKNAIGERSASKKTHRNENATKTTRAMKRNWKGVQESAGERERERPRLKKGAREKKHGEWRRLKSSQENFSNNIEKHVREPNARRIILFVSHTIFGSLVVYIPLAMLYVMYRVDMPFVVVTMNIIQLPAAYCIIYIAFWFYWASSRFVRSMQHAYPHRSDHCTFFWVFCFYFAQFSLHFFILHFTNSEVDAWFFLM